MLRLLLDYSFEYINELQKNKWVGNERLAEMEYDFNKLLQQIIDARVEAIIKSKNQ